MRLLGHLGARLIGVGADLEQLRDGLLDPNDIEPFNGRRVRIAGRAGDPPPHDADAASARRDWCRPRSARDTRGKRGTPAPPVVRSATRLGFLPRPTDCPPLAGRDIEAAHGAVGASREQLAAIAREGERPHRQSRPEDLERTALALRHRLASPAYACRRLRVRPSGAARQSSAAHPAARSRAGRLEPGIENRTFHPPPAVTISPVRDQRPRYRRGERHAGAPDRRPPPD